MISIKDYATRSNKSVQAVYKQIKSHENAKALEGHIFTRKMHNKSTKVLDSVAVEILDEASRQAPTIIVQTEDHALIEQLTQENKNLLIRNNQLYEILLDKSERIEQLTGQLQEANILLLEEKNKPKEEVPEKKQSWLSRIFG